MNVNTWKESRKTFEEQLKRNMYELNHEYPPHWENFINILKSKEKVNRVVDIGCGVGSYKKITNDLGIEYFGYDYSEHAIEIAKETWGDFFSCKSYEEIGKDEIKDNDFLVANALCDVLPNGDQALEYLMNFGSSDLLIQRIWLTDEPSKYTIYNAYDIKSYKYHHNKNTVFGLCKKMNYKTHEYHLYENYYDLYLEKL